MIILLTIVLLLSLMIIQHNRGAHAFVGLVLNAIIIALVIFLISKGVPVVLVMILALAIIIHLTIFEQNGVSKKTVAAGVSIISVMTTILPLLFFISYKGELAGYNELELLEDNSSYLETAIHINMYMIFIVVLLFALVGAIMDTAMAIASSVNEFYEANPQQNYQSLQTHGVQVGKDIMGTTTNTLFFAAFGESLMLCLLFLTNGYTFEHFINSEAFISEFGLILISTIGCVLIIPITGYITARLLTSTSTQDIWGKGYSFISHIAHKESKE